MSHFNFGISKMEPKNNFIDIFQAKNYQTNFYVKKCRKRKKNVKSVKKCKKNVKKCKKKCKKM